MAFAAAGLRRGDAFDFAGTEAGTARRISAPMTRRNFSRSASTCARTTPASEHSSVSASAE
jgi:hypothetical protein